LHSGRSADPSCDAPLEPLAPGTLRLADLAYFNPQAFAEMSRRGVWWLSRVKPRTRVYDAQGRAWSLAEFLAQQTGDTISVWEQKTGCPADCWRSVCRRKSQKNGASDCVNGSGARDASIATPTPGPWPSGRFTQRTFPKRYCVLTRRLSWRPAAGKSSCCGSCGRAKGESMNREATSHGVSFARFTPSSWAWPTSWLAVAPIGATGLYPASRNAGPARRAMPCPDPGR